VDLNNLACHFTDQPLLFEHTQIEKMAPDEKAVIFSQWTSYLDIVEQELRQEGHFYCRIDGTMSADDRLLSMEKFDTDETESFHTPRFILCSLHAW
jgi:SNF2 family DNA or RNA helicase